MKTKLLLLAALAAFALPLRAPAAVSVDFFYDALDPYGEWVDVDDYGYCWRPSGIAADWRPYTVGEWAYTDAGWTWISDEPFGWATYHYGRWARLSRLGWIWVPGTRWAPAWVSWRHSDRYTGWAPLPPESRLSVGVSLGGWVDAYFDLGPTAYSFVETRHFGARRLADVIVAPRQNITIINQTRNVTNVTVVNNVVVNNGPDFEEVARRAERPVRRLRLERDTTVAQGGNVTKARVDGDTVRVAAPEIAEAAPKAKPRKVAQKVEQAEVDTGWKEAGATAEVQAAREKVKAEAKVPENLPAKPARAAKTKAAPATEPAAPPTEIQPPTETQKPAAAETSALPDAPASPKPKATTAEAEKPAKGKAAKAKGAKASTPEPVAAPPTERDAERRSATPETKPETTERERPAASTETQRRAGRPEPSREAPAATESPRRRAAETAERERPERAQPQRQRPAAEPRPIRPRVEEQTRPPQRERPEPRGERAAPGRSRPEAARAPQPAPRPQAAPPAQREAPARQGGKPKDEKKRGEKERE